MKLIEESARKMIDTHYGIDTEWEHPDSDGDVGLERAIKETTLETDDIRTLIQEGIQYYTERLSTQLAAGQAVLGVRPFPPASVNDLINAYAAWDGEVDTFVLVWDQYMAGQDFPCPEHPAGIHSTYLVNDGSCDFCGDKNRG